MFQQAINTYNNKNLIMEDHQDDQNAQNKIKRRVLSEIQKKTLFDEADLSQFNLEIFRNSHLFKNLSFNQLYNLLDKWNLLLKQPSNSVSSQTNDLQKVKKEKRIYQKIYQQLFMIKNRPLHEVQYQLLRFIKLPLISKLINPKNYYPIRMPQPQRPQKSKTINTDINLNVQKFYQRSSSLKQIKSKDNNQTHIRLLNDFYKAQIRRLHNSIQKKQIDSAIYKILKNKSRLACHRIKMRKYQPINCLTLQYGVSRYQNQALKNQI